MTTAQKSPSKTAPSQIAETARRDAVYAAEQLDRDDGSAGGSDCAAHCDPASWSRRFPATAGQVRVVREFVRTRLADHPALHDAGTEAESGCGLSVVKYLRSSFRISDVGNVRNILAGSKTRS
jgi:hypothetical protein